MKIQKHIIRRKVWFYRWLKWIALILGLLLLFCLLFKCCDRPSNSVHPIPPSVVQQPINGVVSPPIALQPWFPSQPGIRQPIDSSQIIDNPDDPLKRRSVAGLLNIYLENGIDIKTFVEELRIAYPEDSIIATFYAEEYQRLQIRIRQERVEFLSRDLKQLGTVKYVLPEWLLSNSSIPNLEDPGYSIEDQYWFYEKIGLFKAWSSGYGSDQIKIAVIDDGFQLSHPELKDKSIAPWNVVDYNDSLYFHDSQLSHGTHVAASIIGNKNNSVGISGVAPACEFMPIQIDNGLGQLSMSAIIDGIFYALKNEADIINLSLGLSLGEVASQLTEREQAYLAETTLKDEAKMWDEIYTVAEKQGTIIVQAAGNDAILSGLDPMKRSSHSIVVGSCSRDLEPSDFSNYGEHVSIYAPGEQIYSAMPNGTIGPLDGTSMASPIVAGCVALALLEYPGITTQELIDRMQSTGRDIGARAPLIQINKLLEGRP